MGQPANKCLALCTRALRNEVPPHNHLRHAVDRRHAVVPFFLASKGDSASSSSSYTRHD